MQDVHIGIVVTKRVRQDNLNGADTASSATYSTQKGIKICIVNINSIYAIIQIETGVLEA